MRRLLTIAVGMLAMFWATVATADQDDDRRGRGRAFGRTAEVEVIRPYPALSMDGLWHIFLDGRPTMRLEVWQSRGGHWQARTLSGDEIDRVYIDPRTGRFDFYELAAAGWQHYRGEVRGGRILGRFSYVQEGPYYDPRTMTVSGSIQPFDRS